MRGHVTTLDSRLALAVLSTTSLLFSAGSVMPAPVLRLTPQSKDVVWIGGTAVASQQGRSARAAVAFAYEEDSRLAFRVEIENLADTPVLVDPARFYYVACNRKVQPPARVCGSSRYTQHPEQVLLDLDMARSRQVASAANDEAFFGAMLLLHATAGIAGAATGPTRAGAIVATTADTAASLTAAAQHQRRRQLTAQELDRANWATAALRKTTLFPGDRVAGLVFLEKDPSASELSLQVRAGDDVLPFGFNQIAYQVRFQDRRGRHAAQGMRF